MHSVSVKQKDLSKQTNKTVEIHFLKLVYWGLGVVDTAALTFGRNA